MLKPLRSWTRENLENHLHKMLDIFEKYPDEYTSTATFIKDLIEENNQFINSLDEFVTQSQE